MARDGEIRRRRSRSLSRSPHLGRYHGVYKSRDSYADRYRTNDYYSSHRDYKSRNYDRDRGTHNRPRLRSPPYDDSVRKRRRGVGYRENSTERANRNASSTYKQGSSVKEKHSKRAASESSNSSQEKDEKDETNELTEEQMMEKLMGIATFDTTKGKNHSVSDVSGVNKRTKRRYRQYMNRKGGFNRPLSPIF